MGFGGLGMWEILLIFLLVLLLFGAKRIPEIAGSMGKGIREFKRNITDVVMNQSVTVVLDSGKPLVITQAADPVSDRKVTVEVKATLLR